MASGSIVVVNDSAEPCHVFVSKHSRDGTSDAWYTLQPGARDSWARDGWEVVAFKDANDTDRAGVYVPVDSTVTFRSLRDITHQKTGSIVVVNASAQPCRVFVSKHSGNSGSDAWFTVQPGERDSWRRDGWELVAFKNADDSDRAGLYVPVNSTITFRGLDAITRA